MAAALRVVVIEDDPDLRKLIQVSLQFTAGWEVTTAADGPEGLARVRDVRPHAVLVDLMMPGMDGYEVCQRLKADPATAAIPLILLTARQHLDDGRVQASGAVAVLRKPFEVAEIVSQVRALTSPRPSD